VTAERSSTGVVPSSDSSGGATGERAYREEEGAAIIHRAARI